jgi:hypothetical protein
LSVTYAVETPASPRTLVSTGWCGRILVQPTSAGIGGDITQSRLGKLRMPVRTVRRTSPVGIASGTASSNFSERLIIASMFGVLAIESGL